MFKISRSCSNLSGSYDFSGHDQTLKQFFFSFKSKLNHNFCLIIFHNNGTNIFNLSHSELKSSPKLNQPMVWNVFLLLNILFAICYPFPSPLPGLSNQNIYMDIHLKTQIWASFNNSKIQNYKNHKTKLKSTSLVISLGCPTTNSKHPYFSLSFAQKALT